MGVGNFKTMPIDDTETVENVIEKMNKLMSKGMSAEQQEKLRATTKDFVVVVETKGSSDGKQLKNDEKPFALVC
tara:strand:+ start:385 stop:606 length:222 start_codon:yes stop_codon:yes gene_type:complete